MTPLYAAYQAAGWAALVLGWPVLAARALADPRYRVGWPERLGFWGRVPRGGVWVHGASQGELRSATPLVEALRARGARPLLTATSPAGRDVAGELAGRDAARFLPLDLGPLVERCLEKAAPRGLVVLETELWPALLRAARRRGVPTLLASARLSDRAFARYRTLGRALAPFLEGFAVIQAQSEEDARRFRALGAPAGRVTVGGNLKFDLPAPDASDPVVRALRRTRAGGWRVVVGGSTHAGEEEALLAAARGEPLAGMKLGLVLAPRKLERLEEVAGVCARAGVPVRLWGELGEPLEGALLRAFGEGAVVVVDRYGLLGRLYGGANAAFVGGSLVPVGGHNLLEPLNWGVPVVFGPHTENAREVAGAVLAEGAGTRVADGAGLASALGNYLTDEDARGAARSGAEALFARNRGATSRVLAVLESVGALEAAG